MFVHIVVHSRVILCNRQNWLEIEKKKKIDFPETLPVFNFCRVMNKTANIFLIYSPVAMATAIFYFWHIFFSNFSS